MSTFEACQNCRNRDACSQLFKMAAEHVGDLTLSLADINTSADTQVSMPSFAASVASRERTPDNKDLDARIETQFAMGCTFSKSEILGIIRNEKSVL